MRNQSLRVKLTVWSALIVGVALLLCCVGALLYIEHEQIEALDSQLQNEARMFFSAAQAVGQKFDGKEGARIKTILPRIRKGRSDVAPPGSNGGARCGSPQRLRRPDR